MLAIDVLSIPASFTAYMFFFLSPFVNCDQTVTKNIARSRKIHQNIEKYRNPEGQEFRTFTGEIPYFFRFLPFLRNLHTVEVTGSNPVSPTLLLSTTCIGERPSKTTDVPEVVSISRLVSRLTTAALFELKNRFRSFEHFLCDLYHVLSAEPLLIPVFLRTSRSWNSAAGWAKKKSRTFRGVAGGGNSDHVFMAVLRHIRCRPGSISRVRDLASWTHHAGPKSKTGEAPSGQARDLFQSFRRFLARGDDSFFVDHHDGSVYSSLSSYIPLASERLADYLSDRVHLDVVDRSIENKIPTNNKELNVV
jgi:hypothetical protein